MGRPRTPPRALSSSTASRNPRAWGLSLTVGIAGGKARERNPIRIGPWAARTRCALPSVPPSANPTPTAPVRTALVRKDRRFIPLVVGRSAQGVTYVASSKRELFVLGPRRQATEAPLGPSRKDLDWC